MIKTLKVGEMPIIYGIQEGVAGWVSHVHSVTTYMVLWGV